MTQKFTLFLLCALYSATGFAQTYTQGDVTITLIPMATHDSTMCASTGQLMYNIVIQNSFAGDSVKVVDPSLGGGVIYAEGNTSGQSPWILTAPVFPFLPPVSDLDISGGFALFFSPETKVISGPDTIYNINNTFPYQVMDPCETDSFSGRVYADNNNNCQYDGGDMPLTSLMVNAVPSYSQFNVMGVSYPGYSDNTGYYNARVISSWLTSVDASLPAAYQFVFPSSTCSPSVYHITNLPQGNVDFALQCSNNLDVQVFPGSPGLVRPLSPFNLHPGVSNTGCAPAIGELHLVLDPRVTYNAGLSTNLGALSGDTLIWSYNNLSSLALPAYWNSFMAQVNLTPNNTVGIGDSLCFELFTAPPAGDINAANNYSTFCVRVVNSYDPNIKEVSPKGEGAAGNIPATTPELTYTVHFQNTGTATAYNVSIIDTLDSDLEPGVLQVVGSSHTMNAEWLTPQVVKFNFYSIMLADSGSDEAGSHGSVMFKVKPKAGLTVGTQIKNSAAIYFDSNAPVITNTVLNTIAEPLAVTEVNTEATLRVFPNPTEGWVTVRSNNLNQPATVRLLSVTGQLLSSEQFNGVQAELNLSGMPAGVYLIELQTKNATSRTKLLKTGN